MKNYKKNFDFIVLIKYITVFCAFSVLNNLEKSIYPYSVSLFSVLIFNGASVIITPVLLFASFLIFQNTGLLLSVSISVFVVLLTQLIYKSFNTAVKYEGTVFCLLSLIGYILLGDTNVYVKLEERLFCAGLTALLYSVFYVAYSSTFKKGIKYRRDAFELVCIFLCLIVFGIGLSNALSPFLFKTISN